MAGPLRAPDPPLSSPQADPSWLVPYAPLTTPGGLTSASLGLQFPLRPRLVGRGNGAVRVKCVASIPGVYWDSAEVGR